MKKVVLSLGSNLCNREQYLLKSTELISCKIGKIVCASVVKETEAWGFEAAPFLNQVLVVETTLTPEEVLETTQAIERALGRTQKTMLDETGRPVYHDRTIDIDLLIFEDEIRNTPTLTLPHPHITERAFVLEPLCELFNDQIIPPFKQSFKQLLQNINSVENEI